MGYKALGEWPCTKAGCGASNRPWNAFCFKKCGGKPDLPFMRKQADIQQKHDKRPRIGQAPYVPPGKRNGAGGATPTDADKRAKAEKARADKAEAELKRLRASSGKPAPTNGKPPQVPAEVKVLQKRLKNYQAVLEDDPDEQGANNQVTQLEAQIEQAMPKTEVQESELQRQLEELQGQVESSQETIRKKREFAAKKAVEAQ